ncbi:MAG: hypothetical protein IZT55_02535 [Anaerolineae bacterium]|nr:hypothetical protein [Anaerolineae bacterium]
MTTETETKTKTEQDKTSKSDNKAVFGPLGKYAAIAVIMVSIIVTTAIMLDRQLNTVEQEIATIENEVAALIIADTTDTAVIVTEETIEEQSPLATVDQNVMPTDTDNTTLETIASSDVVVEANEPTIVSQPAVRNQVQSTDRIATYKLEQKQRMSDLFARIKTLEAQQLDQYKSNQGKQVDRLRKRVTQQQYLIEELIARNKKWFELRTANVQRSQARREDILNRI